MKLSQTIQVEKTVTVSKEVVSKEFSQFVANNLLKIFPDSLAIYKIAISSGNSEFYSIIERILQEAVDEE